MEKVQVPEVVRTDRLVALIMGFDPADLGGHVAVVLEDAAHGTEKLRPKLWPAPRLWPCRCSPTGLRPAR